MPQKIVRIMTFSLYDAHSKPLFEQLHILDSKKLIIHRIALMMYKYSVHLLPVPVSNLSKIVASTGIIRGHVICCILQRLLTLTSVIMEFIFGIS